MSISKKNVKMGELIITTNPENISMLGLGSCIGLVVYDTGGNLFGVAHTALPEINGHHGKHNIFDPTLPAKFTDVAVKIISKKFQENGYATGSLRAKIFGGGQIFENDIIRVGPKNISSVRMTLREEGIKIEGELVGGNTGLSVLQITKEGNIEVRKEGKIFQI